jgi:2-polyprenyl-6-methoxyphenol hydroxylase-like FAD-dependent oxidoreductase
VRMHMWLVRQGLNSALQDVELLAQELEAAAYLVRGAAAPHDSSRTATYILSQSMAVRDLRPVARQDAGAIDAALQRFSESRAPSIRALQELEMLQVMRVCV